MSKNCLGQLLEKTSWAYCARDVVNVEPWQKLTLHPHRREHVLDRLASVQKGAWEGPVPSCEGAEIPVVNTDKWVLGGRWWNLNTEEITVPQDVTV